VKLRSGIYPPAAICAEVLADLRERAERFLGEPVDRAVITVPAYFNDSQREATRVAGQIAGLTVVRMINEPTAAALAHGIRREEGTILIFDLGGGTFDVSIVVIEDGVYRVLGSGGDTRLGGEDFDERLASMVLREIRREHGVELASDPTAMQRLREAVKTARHELSDERRSRLRLPFLSALEDGTPIHVDMELTRGQFEHEVEDLVGRCMKITEDTLKSVGLEFTDLDDILLVGGVTRTPIVRKRLEVISGTAPSTDIDPDRAVAVGAAIQGAALGGLTDRILLMDVTPHDLGIELPHDRFEVIVPRNTSIPTASTRKLTTSRDNQTEISLVVRQGRSEHASRNELLGKLELAKLRKAPRGSVRISLEFSLDASGVVHLNARSADARETIKCALKAPSGLEPEEVEKFTAQHRSRRLIRLVDVQRAEATDHLGRLIGMLERQVANSAEADTARLARLIERGRFLLDKGQEEEQLRMIRWLTKRLNISSDEIPTTNLDNAATAPSFLAAD
jgi:molecular chaperone DnaK